MKSKALFLDRDGIVNREIGRYILNINEFELLPALVPFLQVAANKGYRFVLITNQAGIAKGLYGHDLVNKCHQQLSDELTKHGLRFAAMYYCPHFPEFGECLCRKPGSLMIEKALARFGFDAGSSLMIGDKQRDVDAAEAVGVPACLLPSNPDLSTLLACLP
ncbi:MAG: HAD-IIIA family hydrolase [Bacteroidia bacterium]|jgi:D-glycero-D-manno-heptose 1,7-bisphosphate phosphatase|nr:HAD-IIIA family hydrolase [Bacteroidia bacterium]MCC6769407.1 HAD-IIIA family hydrolase [Bacteroidia bacterium]